MNGLIFTSKNSLIYCDVCEKPAMWFIIAMSLFVVIFSLILYFEDKKKVREIEKKGENTTEEEKRMKLRLGVRILSLLIVLLLVLRAFSPIFKKYDLIIVVVGFLLSLVLGFLAKKAYQQQPGVENRHAKIAGNLFLIGGFLFALVFISLLIPPLIAQWIIIVFLLYWDGVVLYRFKIRLLPRFRNHK